LHDFVMTEKEPASQGWLFKVATNR
jgi:hypothetical protein